MSDELRFFLLLIGALGQLMLVFLLVREARRDRRKRKTGKRSG